VSVRPCRTSAVITLPRALALLTAILLVLCGLAACTHSGGSSSSGSAASVGSGSAPDAAGGVAAKTADGAVAAPSGAQAAASQPADVPLQQKDFVQTATLDIRTADVDGSDTRLTTAAVHAGGSIQQDKRSGSDDNLTAELVLRVPPDHLAAMITLTRSLGTELDSVIEGTDVTTQHADVNARVDALETSVARLRQFLSTSASLSDLIKLEDQLSTRQTQLESTLAQQRALENEIAYSTLTARFSSTPAIAPVVVHHSGPSGFGHALAGGWRSLTVTARWVAAVLGYLLPAMIALALLAVLIRWSIRRLRYVRSPAIAGEPPAAARDQTGQGR
jgi:Domain of unknown function (DUF4349)